MLSASLAATPVRPLSPFSLLALAISPNSMLFSVVDRMFLCTTTVEGIENVYFVYLKTTQAGVYQNPTYADFPQYQSALDGLADCIASSGHGAILGGGAGAPEAVGQSAVSGNYFTALGAGRARPYPYRIRSAL